LMRELNSKYNVYTKQKQKKHIKIKI